MDTPSKFPAKTRRRGRCILVVLAVCIIAVLLVVWFNPKPAPEVFVISTWASNSEQFVTFGVRPFEAEVSFADIVPVSTDSAQLQVFDPGTNAPYILRDMVTPLVKGLPVRYIALPKQWVDSLGSNQPCTPGSYTIAYSPTSAVSQLRVGVANKELPFSLGSLAKRVGKARELNNNRYLFAATHAKPVFVKSEPLTNTAFIAK